VRSAPVLFSYPPHGGLHGQDLTRPRSDVLAAVIVAIRSEHWLSPVHDNAAEAIHHPAYESCTVVRS
jgi:hypothetical protein